MGRSDTLFDACLAVLKIGEPAAKCAAAAHAGALLDKGALMGEPDPDVVPDRPARPERPELVPPSDVPRRRLGSPAGRAALLHAIAHIEFNAIDLAFDMAARFAAEAGRLGLDRQSFMTDWMRIGAEEAEHFSMIAKRLEALGCAYGDHPAHDGLWDAAVRTADSLAARLVVAPLILEARGLDVTPDMMNRLKRAGDGESSGLLRRIYEDEIGHVAAGERWFRRVCAAQNLQPESAFLALKGKYFSGILKPPFNHSARDKAGLPRAFYEPN